MKNLLVLVFASLAVCGAQAQTLDTDFEDGAIPESWTKSVPESPYKGGFSIVTYSGESALKVANVGSNDLGGTYVLKSVTGGLNNTKGNSDNWLTSPEVTIGEKNVFSFRLAANCSYSPYFDTEDYKMRMDVLVICGTDTTKLATIAPVNYFTWKQYAFDLSAFNGKTVKVAFHDYGNYSGDTAKSVSDMKYIDNIKLTTDKYSDYALETVTTLHGQAECDVPYTVKVTNYGLSTGSFTLNYQFGDATPVSETVENTLAGAASMEYTFKTTPVFAPGEEGSFKTWVSGVNDAMVANDSLATVNLYGSVVQTLPYAICNELEDDDEDNDDIIQDEFVNAPYYATYSSSAKCYWYYDAVKYDAWLFTQTKSDDKYVGVAYLYTKKAFTLPAGKVTLKTIGTATLTDMKYEVYIAKYGAKSMADYATKVGESEIMRDVPNTDGGIDTTTVELNIPEAGDYILAIRPINHLANAQMTLIGYSLETAVAPLTATFDPADGSELASFEKGDKITATFSQPEAVGYAEWKLIDNNPEDENDAVLRTGMMKKNDDGSWYGKFYSQQKLLSGHTYTVIVYPYASEADMQSEANHNTYSNALGTFTATYTGKTAGYEYSTVTLVSVTPAENTILKTVNDNVITAVFSDVVTLTANKNGGFSGENTAMSCASEDGKTWTITIPESVMKSTSGALNLNVYVKDANGKVVKGNMGQDENSYYVWNFVTYIGSPDFVVTPADGSTVDQIDKIRASYEEGINYSYATTEKIKVYNGETVVAELGQDALTNAEDFTYIDVTLPTAITEAGTYKVVFPLTLFSLGEEFTAYMSKEQTVTYTVSGELVGIDNLTPTLSQGEGVMYNLAGQRVNANVKGIIITHGKKILK